MKASERAYLAGLIDGEGCIDAFQMHEKPNWIIRVRISQSHFPEVIDWLHPRCGGTRRLRNKKIHTWYAAGKQAKWAIEQALPYLTLKADQARLALHIHDHRKEDMTEYKVQLQAMKRP